MNIVIIGPQASGKGTQAEKLTKAYNLVHLEMGRVLRMISKEDTPIGKSIKELINKGILVSDEVIKQVMNKYLKRVSEMNSVIFDGFPRTLSQAMYLESFLSENGKKIDLVIYLALPQKITVERLNSRRVCEKCGAVFNLLTKPSRTKGFCDECGEKLIVREDETPQAISKRLKLFEKETQPVIKFYEKKGILERIDARLKIEEIFNEIIFRLKKRGLVSSE